jgi:hypothetical protein
MSTIFKLLGSNSTIDEEVNRVVDLEREFEDVWISDKNLNSRFCLCALLSFSSVILLRSPKKYVDKIQFNSISLSHAAIFGWHFSRSLRDKST